MSDDEDPWGRGSDEEEEEEEEEVKREEVKPAFKPKPAAAPPQPTQKTEAQLAMERRRAEAINYSGLDKQVQEMLRANAEMRSAIDDEIQELRAKSELRKAERKAEEERLAEQRAEEDARRKAEEEERQRKKEEEAARRREARAKRMAEFERFQEEKVEPQKSKEQLEAEKKAIMAQRIQPLNIEGLGLTELVAKASELHNTIFRLESDKYDMETRFKKGQADMVELTERARQMRQGGKGKATRTDTESVDKFQELYGAPPKVTTFSSYDRRKDKRSYGERHQVFEGPQFLYPVGRIPPQRAVIWGYEGPEYSGDAPPPPREQAAPPAEPTAE